MSLPERAQPSINGWNPEYVELHYAQWRENPDQVSADWRHFFEGFELGAANAPEAATTHGETTVLGGSPTLAQVANQAKQSSVTSMMTNFRMAGHFEARLDPLGSIPSRHPLLELEEYGLSEGDLDTEFDGSNLNPPRKAPLRELIAFMRETYCSSIGAEFMHIQNRAERQWIQQWLEPVRSKPSFPAERHRRLLTKLRLAEGFERYLHMKYVGQKRFSLEGAETVIVALDSLVTRAADTHQASDVLMGMAHRGRLNVLANIMEKSYKLIFTEFEDTHPPASSQGDGDVKYHKGYSSDHVTAQGNKIHVMLAANPSHLEAVNPVVEGRARAKQAMYSRRPEEEGSVTAADLATGPRACHPVSGAARKADPPYPTAESRRLVIPVLIHGDAAFPGQGIVWETLNLAMLDGYTTGGTIHFIINNQVGFTTNPCDSRSTHYCTDIVKGVEAPIFHVNGDDVAAVAFVTELALDYRQTFGKDVVVDIYCYRRWGHNESDEPGFTQPLMYEQVRRHPGVSSIYAGKLMEMGIMTREDIEAIDRNIQETLNAAQAEAKTATQTQVLRLMEDQAFHGEWKGMKRTYSHHPVETGVGQERLSELAERLSAVPPDFHPHAKLRKQIAGRLEAVQAGSGIDWANAEALAFATLLVEGTPVRLSGQDCRRGTFSHRHATLIDSTNGLPYTPLNNLAPGQAIFEVLDSPLSEASVLGFEYGISLGDPSMLVMWEAQFGDFNNGAQVIIDQFLASSESKWQRVSGLVMLLPHGYEGQGPEHSSARLERFLQLCADENIQVVNCTTPAQYFHLLRRQVRRDFRKPLVVMTPKSLLRLPAATSNTAELASGRFHEIIDDQHANPRDVRRVLLCSGKVYYDLRERQQADGITDVAIIRLEQLYPLHDARLAEVVNRYAAATEFYYVQEEPQNMGAWSYIAPRLRSVLGREFGYIGRNAAASPAAGSLRRHKHEQDLLVRQAVLARDLEPTGVQV